MNVQKKSEAKLALSIETPSDFTQKKQKEAKEQKMIPFILILWENQQLFSFFMIFKIDLYSLILIPNHF